MDELVIISSSAIKSTDNDLHHRLVPHKFMKKFRRNTIRIGPYVNCDNHRFYGHRWGHDHYAMNIFQMHQVVQLSVRSFFVLHDCTLYTVFEPKHVTQKNDITWYPK